MIGFLEKTWPLWWVIGIMALVRWFHVINVAAEGQADDEQQPKRPSPATRNPRPHAV